MYPWSILFIDIFKNSELFLYEHFLSLRDFLVEKKGYSANQNFLGDIQLLSYHKMNEICPSYHPALFEPVPFWSTILPLSRERSTRYINPSRTS